MQGRFGLFGVLIVVVLALVAGGIGYAVGVGSAPVAAGAPGAVVYPYFFHPFGFGLFGFIFFFLLIALLFAAIRGRRWGGGYGPGRGWGGGYGPGGWGRFNANDVPPPMQQALEDWHRQAHGQPGSTGSGASGPTGTAGSTGTGGSPSPGSAS